MNILEIIAKKRDGKKLSKKEIDFFIKGYTDNSISDYQAAALIMAIYINKLDEEETTNLAISMAESGDILDLTELGTVVDKHSTGGVGDKVTLILAPVIASLGIPVAKMSGRGLGFTGGTIDKLESIPGYQTGIEINKFKQNVKDIGISLIGQTLNLAPADKKIYALRDTINCVSDMSLIASSIMSKKIAAGANKIVLDVTCGSGAFMKNEADARELSIIMKKIGELAKKETVCVITNMDEPLGKNIGNTLEIIEVIKALNGEMEEDVKEVVLELGAYMIKLAGKCDNLTRNKEMIIENIQNGKALEKFKQLVEKQGGDITYIENIEKFEKAKYVLPVISLEDGYVNKMNTEEIGNISVILGAGRIRKEDLIDKSVGIVLEKKVGDKVKKEDILAFVYSNSEKISEEAVARLRKAYYINDEYCDGKKTILGVV